MSVAPRITHEKEDVRARAVCEHGQLDALARRLLPEDWARQLPRPEGKDPWTVKDAFAHIVFWKSHTARVIRGERPPEALRGLSYTRLNTLVYQDWRDAAVADVLAWHERVQLQVLAAIDGRDRAWFSSRPRSPFWPADLESHSAEHRRDDIEAALRSRGWTPASASEALSTSA